LLSTDIGLGTLIQVDVRFGPWRGADHEAWSLRESQREANSSVVDLCRTHSVSDVSFQTERRAGREIGPATTTLDVTRHFDAERLQSKF